MVRLRAAAAMILLLMASPVAAQNNDATTPAGILTGIYREAVKGKPDAWLGPGRRDRYVSKSLAALWAKVDAKPPPDGEVGAIDFTVTTDTDSEDLGSFEIKPQNQSATAAVVAVKITYRKPYRGPSPVVTYQFVNENGQWRIDNIRGKEWDLREILKLWLKAS
jgi:hypothetical protein